MKAGVENHATFMATLVYGKGKQFPSLVQEPITRNLKLVCTSQLVKGTVTVQLRWARTQMTATESKKGFLFLKFAISGAY